METRLIEVDQIEGHLLYGEAGGTSRVIGESAPSSAVLGLWRIETEHGVLMLDPEFPVQVVIE